MFAWLPGPVLLSTQPHPHPPSRSPCVSSFLSNHFLFSVIQFLMNATELLPSSGRMMSGRVSPSSRMHAFTPTGVLSLAIFFHSFANVKVKVRRLLIAESANHRYAQEICGRRPHHHVYGIESCRVQYISDIFRSSVILYGDLLLQSVPEVIVWSIALVVGRFGRSVKVGYKSVSCMFAGMVLVWYIMKQ